MLSKLRYAGTEIRSSCEQEELTLGLKALLGVGLVGLRPAAGGTLSICFKGELNGRPRFFKTHAVHSGRGTLQREAAFLKAIAPDHVDPRLLHVGDEESGRIWLHAKQLEACRQLTPSEVRDLIAGYEADLRKCSRLIDQVPRADNIHLLLLEAESAFVFMADKNLLSPLVRGVVRSSIDRVKLVCAGRPLQLCHGDLGPANIMTGGDTVVPLDWEDAFWGVAGYDYLYWLTFFSNRRWLSRDSLGHTPLESSDEIAVMVVILLLKSLISVRDGSYHHNTITIDQRLLEVINLD